MGTSREKYEARRDAPWPRYRVNRLDPRSVCWFEEPRMYYTPEAALARAEVLAARVGDAAVRVGVCFDAGQVWTYKTLREFRAEGRALMS